LFPPSNPKRAVTHEQSNSDWRVVGQVDTAMGQSPQRFWVASPELAAEQIYAAIRRRKRRVYITRRWILVAWLMRLLPDWLYRRLA
jgi:short-subunit dehydrogenase